MSLITIVKAVLALIVLVVNYGIVMIDTPP